MSKKGKSLEKERKRKKRAETNSKRLKNEQMRRGNYIGKKELDNYFYMLDYLKENYPEGNYSSFQKNDEVPKSIYKFLKQRYYEKVNSINSTEKISNLENLTQEN